MKNKLFAAGCILLLFVVTLGARARRPEFEYKLLYQRDFSGDGAQKMLDQMGMEGWELIYVRPRNEYAGGDYVFKRQK